MPAMGELRVIIPAYNADAWLGETVASCLAVPEVARVIVVDDGSRRVQRGVLAGAIDAAGMARVDCVRKDNGGGASARNTGAERFLEDGAAEWAVMLDHDDLLCPGISESLALGARTGAALVVSDRVEFRDDGWEMTRRHAADIRAGDPVRPGRVHTPEHVWTATGLLVHRRVFEVGCRFDSRLAISDDIDFIRQGCRVGPLVCSDAIGLARREFVSGENLSGPKTLVRRVDDVVLLHERWYDDADAAGWRETVRWLLNQLAKRGVSGEPVDRLRAIYRAHGWAVPMKLRWRLARNARRGGSAQIAST
ncbi:MAG: hypothetical protein DHS20C14_00880 [Phycisphaeraceae bacterium]|nr:MAG: hypothetical protein DHS20C14_00880 [Phycisphaeraceae bacterium]